MSRFKEPLHEILRFVGYSAHEWPANRFDGMRDAMRLLHQRGYEPRRVIDCGASMGSWTQMAMAIFPEAEFDVIEPQAGCEQTLRGLAKRTPRVTFHRVAITEAGITQVRMIGGGASGDGTGAWIAQRGEAAEDETYCPATTLDALLAERIRKEDRPFLKLDVEGHELVVLSGGPRILAKTEVVLAEVQFYEINGNRRPVFGDVMTYLRERGFWLYDFACLSSRPRDLRLRMGDVIFIRRDSPLTSDLSWM